MKVAKIYRISKEYSSIQNLNIIHMNLLKDTFLQLISQTLDKEQN